MQEGEGDVKALNGNGKNTIFFFKSNVSSLVPEIITVAKSGTS